MLQILNDKNSNIIETIAFSRLDKNDYERLVPILEEKFEKYGKLRWLFEMRDFKTWTPEAAWEDLKVDLKHANDFERIAMVGDKQWQQWMSQLMKPFTNAKVKYFDLEEEKKAMKWIKKEK